jgi:hypothetical protein
MFVLLSAVFHKDVNANSLPRGANSSIEARDWTQLSGATTGLVSVSTLWSTAFTPGT